MTPFNSGNHNNRGMLTTRGSERNGFKNAFTPAGVADTGVPRLTNKILCLVILHIITIR